MNNSTLKVQAMVLLFATLMAGLTAFNFATELSGQGQTIYSPKQAILPSVRILAPYGESRWGPYRDGVIIVGDESFQVNVIISYPSDAPSSLKNIKVWLDTVGEPEEGFNVTFVPRSNQNARAFVFYSNGSLKSEFESTTSGRFIYLEFNELLPGERIEIRYTVYAPTENEVPKLPYTIVLKEQIQFGQDVAPQVYEKVIKIVNRPILRLAIIWVLAIGVFAGLLILGHIGFFRIYSTMDLVSMSIVGATMVVWVQIIGRQLVFPVVDRIPFAFNFAVADFPYILLLVTAIALVRKPGAASLTLFVYNIVSEIGWYGLNFLWWAYPFAQGLPVDLYLLIRGKGALTDKFTFFKLKITEEELESARSIPGLKYLDGLIIGFLRGFFMQSSLYLVFYPNLFRVEYFWEYVFWWHVIPWSIGNAISAAISIPIVERIEEALTY